MADLAGTDPDRRLLGAVLRRLRTAAGLSQAAIEAATGIHQSKVSAWERGDTSRPYPQLDEIAAVERALGVTRGAWLVEAEVVDVPRSGDVAKAIAYDPLLTPRDREIVLATYERMITPAHDGSARRPG